MRVRKVCSSFSLTGEFQQVSMRRDIQRAYATRSYSFSVQVGGSYCRVPEEAALVLEPTSPKAASSRSVLSQDPKTKSIPNNMRLKSKIIPPTVGLLTILLANYSPSARAGW